MIRRLLCSFLLLMGLVGGFVQPVLADDHHEDPASAKNIFNGMTLLMHYYDTLRDMGKIDVPNVENSLTVMPFANIPKEILPATTKFNSKSIDFTHSLYSLFTASDEQNALLRQFRLIEVAQIGSQIAADLKVAREELSDMKSSLDYIAIYLKIAELPTESGIRQYYELVVKEIIKLNEMLSQLDRVPSDFNEQIKQTELTLVMSPQAYVGDQINLSGRLTSQGTAMPERIVTIYLARQASMTAQTDSEGYFQGSVLVPALYQPVITVQAVYIPLGPDTKIYMGSSSTALNLQVNYYAAKLNLTMPGKAYPGQTAVLNGSFDYKNQYLEPPARTTEIYLDDTLLATFSSGTSFSRELDFPADIFIGLHTLIVTVHSEGRYAPVAVSFQVDVNLIPLMLDVNLPGVVFVPGQIRFDGRVSSPLGPSPNVIVTANGSHKSRVLTADDGSFRASVPTSWGLSLLGFQSITLQIQALEPWYSSLELTERFFAVNYVNCLLLLVALVTMSIYLPRRLNKWLGVNTNIAGVPQQPSPLTPVFSNSAAPSAKTELVPETGEPSRGTLWNIYLRVLKMVQNLTRSVLKPQQTLREYANESSTSLGPLARPFVDLTLLAESCLYSNRKPSADDLEKGRVLSQSIHKEAEHEDI